MQARLKPVRSDLTEGQWLSNPEPERKQKAPTLILVKTNAALITKGHAPGCFPVLRLTRAVRAAAGLTILRVTRSLANGFKCTAAHEINNPSVCERVRRLPRQPEWLKPQANESGTTGRSNHG
jgi:hypothetical protein